MNNSITYLVYAKIWLSFSGTFSSFAWFEDNVCGERYPESVHCVGRPRKFKFKWSSVCKLLPKSIFISKSSEYLQGNDMVVYTPEWANANIYTGQINIHQ